MDASHIPGHPCVLFAGGGTGGHLFPGIAVAQELRRRHPDWRIVFAGTERGIEKRQVPRYGFELALLPVFALRGRSPMATVRSLLKLPAAGVHAMALVRRLRPQVAVSVGGYAAGPAVLAARAQGICCIVMEQNAFAGMTNRALARLSKHVLLSLPNPQLGRHKGAQILGNPVRHDLLCLGESPLPQTERHFTQAQPLRIFVFGGSQGAHAINAALVALAPLLAARQLPVRVVHQTGGKDAAWVQQAYKNAGLHTEQAQATDFVDDMAGALGAAELLICRSGASTLAELAVVGRASILVPYPSAADDHQSANARVFAEAGAGIFLAEHLLTAERLLQEIEQLLQVPQRLQQMAGRARALALPRAVFDIADIIEKEVQRVSQ